jgi:hypothetical protein
VAQCIVDNYLATDVPQRSIMAARMSPELMAEVNATLSDLAATCNP